LKKKKRRGASAVHFCCAYRIFSLKYRSVYIDVRNLLQLNKKSIPTIHYVHFCRLISSRDEHVLFEDYNV